MKPQGQGPGSVPILLGQTATPERMDGDNVAADFHNRFAAEIRLPEALEEKLLCPFHYFGVADSVDIREDFVNESEICLSFSVACHMIIL
jgi:superfamily II DNA or RNA helicase